MYPPALVSTSSIIKSNVSAYLFFNNLPFIFLHLLTLISSSSYNYHRNVFLWTYMKMFICTPLILLEMSFFWKCHSYKLHWNHRFLVLTHGFLDSPVCLYLFPIILPLDCKFFVEETIFLYIVCTVLCTMGFRSRTSRCSNNENNFESKSQNVFYFTETLYKIMIV